ncbi:CVNH domain protein [Ceratocystis platani]|uniref:CVNH domain protein n=1 Tax=Ceratocystis fimbriata f. sp. platani TaxID=88771 RepID=A0A0F8B691_CERFI|nr:CVNH domain protein [Ceratocystis platani]
MSKAISSSAPSLVQILAIFFFAFASNALCLSIPRPRPVDYQVSGTQAVAHGSGTAFGDSCRNVKLNASFYGEPEEHYSHVNAKCQSDEGKYVPSSLNLNQYIGNFDGKLKWDVRGGFTESCFDCYLRRHSSWKQFTVLHCVCKRAGEKGPVWFPSKTEIDLDTSILNVAGELVAVGISEHTPVSSPV